MHGSLIVALPYPFVYHVEQACPFIVVSNEGSKEGHTAYLYRCTHQVKAPSKSKGIVETSDELFKEAFRVLSENQGSELGEWVKQKQQEDDRTSGRSPRPRTRTQAKAAVENAAGLLQ